MSEGSLHLHKVSSTHLETPTVHGIFSVQHSPSLHVPFLRTLASKAQHVICSAAYLSQKGLFQSFPFLWFFATEFSASLPLYLCRIQEHDTSVSETGRSAGWTAAGESTPQVW